jgi:acyl dehydratase
MSRYATVGEQFASLMYLDPEQVSRFAAMAGDENPLHHDEEHARTTRFGGLIASGTHVVATFMGVVATHYSRKGGALGLEFSFRLRKAARVGDTLQMRWRVVRVEPKAMFAGEIAFLEGEVLDGSGEVAVTGTATVLLSERL